MPVTVAVVGNGGVRVGIGDGTDVPTSVGLDVAVDVARLGVSDSVLVGMVLAVAVAVDAGVATATVPVAVGEIVGS